MAQKGRINDFYKQFEELNNKLDKANSTIAQLTLNNSMLISEIKDLKESLNKKDELISQLVLEIERLKNNNKKDSSNSSKPSSTNGFKKVVTNNREKSTNSKGGQKGHKGQTLTKETIDKMIENGDIDEVIMIEENKTENTKNNKPIITYEYDIQIKKIVIKHVYYPNTQKNIISSPVVYGNNIKSFSTLMYMKGSSYDAIKSLVNEFTDNVLNPSKGTLYNWINNLSGKIETTEYEKIKEELLNSLVLHVDESPIKINGKQYYIHNISNNTHTLQYVSENRGKKAVDEFGFLNKYKGILVHDHFTMYYNYGTGNAECNVHALRYLKAVSEFTKHEWAKELSELLLEMKKRKEELIITNKEYIDDVEYNDFKNRYLNIIKNGYEEYLKDIKTNSYRNDERKLLNRLKKYIDNHLLFLKKFFVPFSNNRAESDLRTVKIRQKTGKFRSVAGASNYTVLRSYTSTCSKNNEKLNYTIKSLFKNDLISI
jgi:transposase-like protein